MYTDYINLYVMDTKDKLTVFDKNGPYLATKKIGKNNPKASQMRQDNEIRMKWNQKVDRALVSGAQEKDILQVKEERITQRIKNSIAVFGDAPLKFAHIVTMAIGTLGLLIAEVLKAAKTVANVMLSKERNTSTQVPINHVETGKSDPIVEECQADETKNKSEALENGGHVATDGIEEVKLKMLSENEILIEQHDFLEAVGQTLSNKNGVIFKLEKERNEAQIELEDCRSIFMKKRRVELENKISKINGQIETYKAEFAEIVLRNGFQNVSDFYKRLYASRKAWKKNTNAGKKSIVEQLEKYDREKENRVNATVIRKENRRGVR